MDYAHIKIFTHWKRAPLINDFQQLIVDTSNTHNKNSWWKNVFLSLSVTILYEKKNFLCLKKKEEKWEMKNKKEKKIRIWSLLNHFHLKHENRRLIHLIWYHSAGSWYVPRWFIALCVDDFKSRTILKLDKHKAIFSYTHIAHRTSLGPNDGKWKKGTNESRLNEWGSERVSVYRG